MSNDEGLNPVGVNPVGDKAPSPETAASGSSGNWDGPGGWDGATYALYGDLPPADSAKSAVILDDGPCRCAACERVRKNAAEEMARIAEIQASCGGAQESRATRVTRHENERLTSARETMAKILDSGALDKQLFTEEGQTVYERLLQREREAEERLAAARAEAFVQSVGGPLPAPPSRTPRGTVDDLLERNKHCPPETPQSLTARGEIASYAEAVGIGVTEAARAAEKTQTVKGEARLDRRILDAYWQSGYWKGREDEAKDAARFTPERIAEQRVAQMTPEEIREIVKRLDAERASSERFYRPENAPIRPTDTQSDGGPAPEHEVWWAFAAGIAFGGVLGALALALFNWWAR
jgi:hypothetical protein